MEEDKPWNLDPETRQLARCCEEHLHMPNTTIGHRIEFKPVGGLFAKESCNVESARGED